MNAISAPVKSRCAILPKKLIKDHPAKGVEILKPLKFLETEKKIILHHHERIDGKGYPAGLKGQEIPFESRLISVVDIFDAMNSARAYRAPLPQEVILEELKKASGTQLEAALVQSFLSLLANKPRLWSKSYAA